MGKVNNEERRNMFGADMERVHPTWGVADIQYAWQMMPSSNAVFHPPGTVVYVAERERHERVMQVFIAYVMNPDAEPFASGSHWAGDEIVLKPRATGSLNGSGAKARTRSARPESGDGVEGDKAQPVGKMVKAGSKKAAVAEMVRRANGCTLEEICSELAIGAVAARGLLSDCRKAGVAITLKEGRYLAG